VARVTFNGTPGEAFTNDTDRVLYQFHCQFSHSCGVCIHYHLAIGPYFPIPLHRGCRCSQAALLPGATAEPFVDFLEEITKLDPHQQAAVMGRSNWQLVESGVVSFADVVTPTRVRDLREVVALNTLSVEQMTKAGVGRRVAAEAYQSVNTPEHRLIAKKQAELVASLKTKGLSTRQIETAVGQRVAAKVTIEGPSGPGVLPVRPTTPRPFLPALFATIAARLGIKLPASFTPR
jgi:hypothetical protein